MRCSRCGHPNDDRARFCSSCGASLPGDVDATTMQVAALDDRLAAEEELRAQSEGVPAGVGVLVVARGPNAGSRFLLDAPVTTAGRHPDSNLFLDDVTVSRRHAEIVRSEDGYRLRDVGSLNGTYVNGERVDDQALRNGDVIQIGLYRLTFVVGGDD